LSIPFTPAHLYSQRVAASRLLWLLKAVIIALILSLQAHADSPLPPPTKVVQISEGYKFAVTSDPQGNTTTCRDRSTGRVRWTIPQWYRNFYISPDGDHLVTTYDGVNLIPLNYPNTSPLLTFWKAGKKIKEVSVGELIPNRRILKRTVSHYYWGNVLGIRNGNLEVRLANDQVLHFDMKTGQRARDKRTGSIGPAPRNRR
jgi:hypothetical protein